MILPWRRGWNTRSTQHWKQEDQLIIIDEYISMEKGDVVPFLPIQCFPSLLLLIREFSGLDRPNASIFSSF